MIRDVARRRILLATAFALAGAFAVSAGFETQIANTSARTGRAVEETLAAERALARPLGLEATQAAVERRVAALHLMGSARSQDLALLLELDAIAARHALRVTTVRSDARAQPLARSGHFTARGYEVALEGRYGSALAAIADLSRAALVIRTDRIDLDRRREGGRSTGDVRATLGLSLLHFTGKGNDARTHAP